VVFCSYEYAFFGIFQVLASILVSKFRANSRDFYLVFYPGLSFVQKNLPSNKKKQENLSYGSAFSGFVFSFSGFFQCHILFCPKGGGRADSGGIGG
jgi:hypothetical protein